MKRIFKLSLLVIFLVNAVFLSNCSKDDPTSPNNINHIVSNTNFTAEDSFFYEIDPLIDQDILNIYSELCLNMLQKALNKR